MDKKTKENLMRNKFDSENASLFMEIMEFISARYPQYKSMTLEELMKNKDFIEKFAEEEKERAAFEKFKELMSKAVLKSRTPKIYNIPNNKLSNEITKNFTDKGEIALAVINPGKKGEVLTYNSLTYEDKNITMIGSREFTAHDRVVHNSVCSLYNAGNNIITPAMICRTMNGMTEHETPGEKEIEAVRNSLDKSRFLRLKVDFTEEAKARGFNTDKTTIDTNLLNAEVLIAETGGKKVEAYRILSTPILYQYAQMTNQIISVPLKLLNTKKTVRNSDKIMLIKEYLIRRIENMKYSQKMVNKIFYETIFEETGIVITHDTERDRYRKYIKEILKLWKIESKYIKNSKEFREGNACKGIEILF